ncbi:MAG TPA: phosphoenolpyruvate carboxylase [Actinomycetes bacterium]
MPITEPVHRGRALARTRQVYGGWLQRAAEHIRALGLPPEHVAAKVSRLAVRPVFTVHPTEAARHTTLSKMRRIAQLLGDDPGPRPDQRLAELLDLLWQTDDLRVAQPDPVDEARNAVYYLDELYRDAVPEVLEELSRTPPRQQRRGVRVPDHGPGQPGGAPPADRPRPGQPGAGAHRHPEGSHPDLAKDTGSWPARSCGSGRTARCRPTTRSPARRCGARGTATSRGWPSTRPGGCGPASSARPRSTS